MKKTVGLTVLLLMLLSLTGCVRLKNDEEIVKWANYQYDIQTEVVGSREIENGKEFTLKSSDGVVFEAVSVIGAVEFCGAEWGKTEGSRSNYYEKLIDFREKEITAIENTYHVEFVEDSGGLIHAVYMKNFHHDAPEQDLQSISAAVKELGALINPQDSYDTSGRNRIYLRTDDEENLEVDWHFKFRGPEIGAIMNWSEEFYVQIHHTVPQLDLDGRNWSRERYPEYKKYSLTFHFPKTLAMIEISREEEGVLIFDPKGVLYFYVDVLKYNQLYEEKAGNISVEDFEQCVMTQDEVDFRYYQDLSEEGA